MIRIKKMLSVLLALSFLCASAYASEIDTVVEYVEGVLMMTPQVVDQAFNRNALNLLILDDGAAITWTDAANSKAYALSGALEDMVNAYELLIPLTGWDTCGVFEGKNRVLVYDHTENGTIESANTYDEYAASVAAYFSTEQPTEKSVRERDYVLNTGKKKFHLPSCPSVDQMSKKNRQDYHGTRDDLISRGYEPCGRCNP